MQKKKNVLIGLTRRNYKLGFEEGSAGPEQHCHSEKVAHYFRGNLHRIPGSLSSYIPLFCTICHNLLTKIGASNRGIATPVCALARNDREFVKFQFHDQLIKTDNLIFPLF